ncbi:MAG: chemotaxis protein CheW [Lachnospiraceae bacterium]|nr:chemotaxis protein CheW [Lachnospiraceae bacterium]
MAGNQMEIIDQEKVQYIVVKLGSEQYGLNISFVDNIVRMQKITRVPKAPHHYVGVINLRGEIVPVMSVRRKMGLEDDEYTNRTRIIILKLEVQGLIGVIVDEVKEVINLGEDDIDRNVQNANNRADANFINGIGKDGEELISIFEITSIVDAVETV